MPKRPPRCGSIVGGSCASSVAGFIRAVDPVTHPPPPPSYYSVVRGNQAIAALEGVVDHGLFLDMVSVCIIAGKTGIEVKERK